MRRALITFAAILTSGVLLTVSLPPGGLGALGWFVLSPILVALRGTSFGRGFLASLAACMLAAWLSVQGWLYPAGQWHSLEERMAGEAAWHYMGFLMMAVVAGIVVGIWAETANVTLGRIAFLACLGIALESLTAIQLPVMLGLTQYRSMAMMAVASVSGLLGVSTLVWLGNLWFGWVLSSWRPAERSSLNRFGLAASLSVVVLAAVTTYPLPGPVNPTRRGRAFAALQSRSFDGQELLGLSQSTGAWLTVLPELSAVAEAPGGKTGKLLAAVRSRGIRVATTFEDDATPKRHNTMSVLGPKGESQRYWKRKLFGGEAQNHAPGCVPSVAQVEGLALGLNVCFDSCFPNLIRDTASTGEPRPALVLLPCMGPESPNGVVQAMHGAFTPFRSAENGVGFVRAETSAAAMITDANGRIQAYAEPGFQGAIVAELTAERKNTAYSLLGDWIGYVAIFWVVAYPLGCLIKVRASPGRLQGKRDDLL